MKRPRQPRNNQRQHVVSVQRFKSEKGGFLCATKLTDKNVVIVNSFIFMSTLDIWFFGTSTLLVLLVILSLRQEDLKLITSNSKEIKKSPGKLRKVKENWEKWMRFFLKKMREFSWQRKHCDKYQLEEMTNPDAHYDPSWEGLSAKSGA